MCGSTRPSSWWRSTGRARTSCAAPASSGQSARRPRAATSRTGCWPSSDASRPADPVLEEGTLSGVRGEVERAAVGLPRLLGLAEGPEQLGAGGVEERVPVQVLGEPVQLVHGGLGARELALG